MNKALKKIGIAMGALLLITAMGGEVKAQDTLALSLKDALKIAQSNNLTVKIADYEIVKTGYGKKGSYAALFPQIDFSGSYQRTIEKQQMSMNMGGQSQSIKVGTTNNFNVGFGASMPLVNVALWKNLKISGLGVDLAVEQAKQSRQDLINQVEQAYYSALLAADSYEVYKENYINAEDNYKQIKSKYESGLAAEYDMIRAEVQMQNALPNVYDSQNALTLALWQLKAVMGVDLKTNIRCIGGLMDYQTAMNEVVMASDSVNLDNNSALKQLDIQEEILSKTYQAKLAAFYPTLSASASYSWIAMANSEKFKDYKWNPYSVAGVTLSIPLFSGGKRYFDVKQSRVDQNKLALERENTVRGLMVEVKQDLNSMETAVKQYGAANSTVSGAQTGYNIAKKKYEVGHGTLLEMNDAQLALLQAKLNVNNAIYQFLVSKSKLDLTLGVNSSESESYYNEQANNNE